MKMREKNKNKRREIKPVKFLENIALILKQIINILLFILNTLKIIESIRSCYINI